MLIKDVLGKLVSPDCKELPAPHYIPDEGMSAYHKKIGLAVESMKRHMTNEGWELFDGLNRGGGYELVGHALPYSMTNVPSILQALNPGTLVLQDKREWDGLTAGGKSTFNSQERFSSVEVLRERPDIFKLTVLKDAQNGTQYHRQSAEEIGCHAWVVYYHPKIVNHLAPYVRERHLVRTYHSIDPAKVPAYSDSRYGACVSGAVSKAYPLRTRIFEWARSWQLNVTALNHPGYRRDGCKTDDYLQWLSTFKVAICTSSVYGYALRKVIEATACGCRVITNLPQDEVLPEIDANLVSVSNDISCGQLEKLIHDLVVNYDPVLQEKYVAKAIDFYDFRVLGKKLAEDIEKMREGYNVPNES